MCFCLLVYFVSLEKVFFLFAFVVPLFPRPAWLWLFVFVCYCSFGVLCSYHLYHYAMYLIPFCWGGELFCLNARCFVYVVVSCCLLVCSWPFRLLVVLCPTCINMIVVCSSVSISLFCLLC